MHSITSHYAPHQDAYRVYPEGRPWLNPESGNAEFINYGDAYEAVRHYLLTVCDWQPSPGERGDLGGLMPKGHDRSCFNFGALTVNADGEAITIAEA